MAIFNWGRKKVVDSNNDDYNTEMDYGFNDFGMDSPADKTASQSFRSGMAAQLLEMDDVRKSVVSVLPQGYSDVDRVFTELNQGYDELTTEVNKQVETFRKYTEGSREKLEKVLPQSLVNLLLGHKQEHYKFEKRDEIKEELEKVFAATSSQEESPESKVQTNLSKAQHVALTSMATNLSKIAKGYETIDLNYKRKTLELALRSNKILSETFNLQYQSFGAIVKSLKEIQKTSAMPDYAKKTLPGVWRESIARGMVGKFNSKVFGGSDDSFVSRITKSLVSGTASIGNQINELASGLQMLEGVEGDTIANQIGRSVASWGKDQAVKTLYAMFSKETIDKIKRQGKKFEYMVNELEPWTVESLRSNQPINVARLKDYLEKTFDIEVERDEYTDSDPFSVANRSLEFFKSWGQKVIDDTQGGSGSVALSSTKQLTEQSFFTLQTQRSITHTIPGYLSKILSESTAIRTGLGFDNKIGELRYDYVNSKFTDKDTFKDEMDKRVLSQNTKDSMFRSASYFTDKFKVDEDGAEQAKALGLNDLDPKVLREVQKHLLREASSNTTFETMLRSGASSKDQEVANVFAKLQQLGVADKEGVHDPLWWSIANEFNSLRNSVRGSSLAGPLQNEVTLGNLDVMDYDWLNKKTGSIDKKKFLEALMDDSVPTLPTVTSNGATPTVVQTRLDKKKRKGLKGVKPRVQVPTLVNPPVVPVAPVVQEPVAEVTDPVVPLGAIEPGDAFVGPIQPDKPKGWLSENISHLSEVTKEKVTGLLQAIDSFEVRKLTGPRAESTLAGDGLKETTYVTKTDKIISLIESLSEKITALPSAFVGPIDPNSPVLGALGTDPTGGTKKPKAYGSLFEALVGTVGDLKDSVTTFVPNAYETVSDWFSSKNDEYGDTFSEYMSSAGEALKAAPGVAWEKLGDLREGMFDHADVYIPGFKGPILLGSKLRVGDYYVVDEEGKRIAITSLKTMYEACKKSEDGFIRDVQTDEVVVNIKDIADAVKNKTGYIRLKNKTVALGVIISGAFSRLSEFGSMVGRGVLGGGWSTVKFAWDFVKDQVKERFGEQQDIYVKGRAEPVLLKIIMQNGGYFRQSDYEVIESYKDIDGPVLDAQGDVVLSSDDIKKGLVDRYGKPLTHGIGRAWNFVSHHYGKVKRTLDRGLRTAGRVALGVVDGLTGRSSMPEMGGYPTGLGGNLDPDGWALVREANSEDILTTLGSILGVMDSERADRIEEERLKRKADFKNRDAVKEEQERRKANEKDDGTTNQQQGQEDTKDRNTIIGSILSTLGTGMSSLGKWIAGTTVGAAGLGYLSKAKGWMGKKLAGAGSSILSGAGALFTRGRVRNLGKVAQATKAAQGVAQAGKLAPLGAIPTAIPAGTTFTMGAGTAAANVAKTGVTAAAAPVATNLAKGAATVAPTVVAPAAASTVGKIGSAVVPKAAGMSKFAKGNAITAGVIGGGLALHSLSQGDYEGAIGHGLGAAGAIGGAKVGAMMGTILGPVGMAVGALVGGVVGGIALPLLIPAYKWATKNHLTPETTLRYLGYGFKPDVAWLKSIGKKILTVGFGKAVTTGKYVSRIFELEMYMYMRTSVSGGKIQVNTDISERDNHFLSILKKFKVKYNDEESITRFANWFHNRFIPVYVAHCQARVDAMETPKLDSEMKPIEIVRYLENLEFPEEALSISTPPSRRMGRLSHNGKAIEKLKAKMLKEGEKDLDKDQSITTREDLEAEDGTEEDKANAKFNKANREVGISRGGYVIGKEAIEVEDKFLKKGTWVIDDKGIVVYATTGKSVHDELGRNQINDVLVLASGIPGADKRKEALQASFLMALQLVKVNKKGITVQEPTNTQFTDLCFKWGIQPEGNKDKDRRDQLFTWFIARYCYTLGNILKYCGDLGFHLRDNSRYGFNQVINRLSQPQRLVLTNAIIDSKTEISGTMVSIWDVNIDGITSPNAKTMLDLLVKSLEILAKKDSDYDKVMGTASSLEQMSVNTPRSSVVNTEFSHPDVNNPEVTIPQSLEKPKEQYTGFKYMNEFGDMETSLSEITAVRLYAYGLSEMNPQVVTSLMRLENILKDNIIIDGAGLVNFDMSVEDCFEKAKSTLRIGKRTDMKIRDDTNVWFIMRFVPVYLTYASCIFGVRKINLKAFDRSIEKSFKASEKLNVCNALIATEHVGKTHVTPIWEINYGPYNIKVGLDSSVTDNIIKNLELEAEKEQQALQVDNSQEVKDTIVTGEVITEDKSMPVAEAEAKFDHSTTSTPTESAAREIWDTDATVGSYEDTSQAMSGSGASAGYTGGFSSINNNGGPTQVSSSVMGGAGSDLSAYPAPGSSTSLPQGNSVFSPDHRTGKTKIAPGMGLPLMQLQINAARELGITNPDEIAAYLGQTIHETGNYTSFGEGMNYSAKRMREVFKRARSVPQDKLQQIAAGGPRSVANFIYATTNGNKGGEDGWNYRGSGPIQLTGRGNFVAAAQAAGIPEIVENPELVRTDPMMAAKGSLGWWLKNAKGTTDPDTASRKVNRYETGKLGVRREATKVAKELIRSGRLKIEGTENVGLPDEGVGGGLTPTVEGGGITASGSDTPSSTESVGMMGPMPQQHGPMPKPGSSADPMGPLPNTSSTSSPSTGIHGPQPLSASTPVDSGNGFMGPLPNPVSSTPNMPVVQTKPMLPTTTELTEGVSQEEGDFDYGSVSMSEQPTDIISKATDGSTGPGDLRGQAYAGGKTHIALFKLARMIQKYMGNDLIRFTGFNDTYHKTGRHAQGLALDCTIKSGVGGSDYFCSVIGAILAGSGLKGADYYVLNEYKTKSKNYTAPHIHVQINGDGKANSFASFKGRGGKMPKKGEKVNLGSGARSTVEAEDKKASQAASGGVSGSPSSGYGGGVSTPTGGGTSPGGLPYDSGYSSGPTSVTPEDSTAIGQGAYSSPSYTGGGSSPLSSPSVLSSRGINPPANNNPLSNLMNLITGKTSIFDKSTVDSRAQSGSLSLEGTNSILERGFKQIADIGTQQLGVLQQISASIGNLNTSQTVPDLGDVGTSSDTKPKDVPRPTTTKGIRPMVSLSPKPYR